MAADLIGTGNNEYERDVFSCEKVILVCQIKINMNREELLALMKQKDDIESELRELSDELKSQDNIGMAGELVDKEGYPRYVKFSL